MEVKRQYAYFSAAIRDGAKLGPQSFGSRGYDGSLCAIAAGCAATNIDYMTDDVVRAYPYLLTPARCPVCDVKSPIVCENYKGFALLAHINDFHKWTREQIADWLYAEEEKLGFVTISDETEAHKTPEAGRGDSVVTEAQAGVLA